MQAGIKMGTWVIIHDDCPLRFTINGDCDAEMFMGQDSCGFELVLSAGALERFLALGAEALAEAKQQRAEKDAAWWAKVGG